MTAISIENLHKRYGEHQAVRNLSFSINEGEVVGFLGPNGAGKSTTMKILTGFIAPSSGQASIRGINVLEHPTEAQKQIGYLPENAPIYSDMRIREYLNYIAKIRGMGRSERSHAIEKIAGQCGIADRLNQPIAELSKGYKQRVGLAQALIHNPPIVILDEPTTGLDPNQIIEIRNLIREIGKTKTVILSTHILSEVQRTCDRVIIIHQGELVADGKVADIIAESKAGLQYRTVFSDDKVSINAVHLQEKLEELQGVIQVQLLPNIAEGQVGFSISSTEDIRRSIFHLSLEQGIALLELSPSQGTLEAVFHHLTEQ